MKRASLITIHLGANFGSILQTIASCKTIEKFGYSSEVLNYVPDRVTFKRYWKKGLKSPIKFLRRVLAFPNEVLNKRIYNGFLARHASVSRPIYRTDDFTALCPKADVYVSGSDQIWNSKHNEFFDTHYFFDGIAGKKVAYSSSFGQEELPVDEYEKVKAFLGEYSAISVREASAKKIVESMGYECEHLLDPTFMLNREDWKQYMSPRKIKEKYLLLYLPYNVVDWNVIFESARNIAREKNLKVVTFSWDFRRDKRADYTIRYANPGDFLSLMYYADYVITNSFHGTAFSINLNKQFWTYLPSGFGTRIRSVIELCKLNRRVVDAVFGTESLNDVIDYNEVNSIIDSEREKAMAFLKDALSD